MIQQLLRFTLNLSRTKKRLLVAVFDVIIIITSIWASFSLRLDRLYIPTPDQFWIFLLAPFIAIPIFIRLGLYRAIIRYIGFQALWAVARAVALYTFLWSSVVLLSGVQGVPRSVYILNFLLVVLLAGGSRMAARWLFLPQKGIRRKRNASRCSNVVVYGAGDAGVQLALALSHSLDQRPIAFIDDDPSLHKQDINGLKVYSFNQLSYLIDKFYVQEVLLAMPLISRSRRLEIIKMLEPYPVHVRTWPDIAAITKGTVKIEDITEVDIGDILGRDVVPPNHELLDANI